MWIYLARYIYYTGSVIGSTSHMADNNPPWLFPYAKDSSSKQYWDGSSFNQTTKKDCEAEFEKIVIYRFIPDYHLQIKLLFVPTNYSAYICIECWSSRTILHEAPRALQGRIRDFMWGVAQSFRSMIIKRSRSEFNKGTAEQMHTLS